MQYLPEEPHNFHSIVGRNTVLFIKIQRQTCCKMWKLQSKTFDVGNTSDEASLSSEQLSVIITSGIFFRKSYHLGKLILAVNRPPSKFPVVRHSKLQLLMGMHQLRNVYIIWKHVYCAHPYLKMSQIFPLTTIVSMKNTQINSLIQFHSVTYATIRAYIRLVFTSKRTEFRYLCCKSLDSVLSASKTSPYGCIC